MKLGITTRSYSGMSTADTAKAMQDAGFVWCELCFCQSDLSGWTYNGREDFDAAGITPEKVAAAAKIYREHGVEPVSLGAFGDLRDPDENEAAADRNYFRRYFELCEAAEIPYVASECGFTQGRRGVNADTYESDYSRLKATFADILPDAKKHGVTFALECCLLDVVPSPRRLSGLISQLKDEYGIDNLKALLDPANFIANADEDDMFKYLYQDIAYIHGKDRCFNSAYGCNIGEGDINWAKFFINCGMYDIEAPFVFEYCSGDAIPKAIATAQKFSSWAKVM